MYKNIIKVALLYMPPMTLLQPTDFCCSKAFYSILWEIMSLFFFATAFSSSAAAFPYTDRHFY